MGPHSYDPGVSQTLAFWTTQIPNNSVFLDLEAGEAILDFRNLRTVFDAFTVPNSGSSNRALGFVGAIINSLRIHWTGVLRRVSYGNPVTQFSGQFVETLATIEVTTTTPATRPPFTPTLQNRFRFVADPATTVTNFAQIGRERNGIFFPG